MRNETELQKIKRQIKLIHELLDNLGTQHEAYFSHALELSALYERLENKDY